MCFLLVHAAQQFAQCVVDGVHVTLDDAQQGHSLYCIVLGDVVLGGCYSLDLGLLRIGAGLDIIEILEQLVILQSEVVLRPRHIVILIGHALILIDISLDGIDDFAGGIIHRLGSLYLGSLVGIDLIIGEGIIEGLGVGEDGLLELHGQQSGKKVGIELLLGITEVVCHTVDLCLKLGDALSVGLACDLRGRSGNDERLRADGLTQRGQCGLVVLDGGAHHIVAVQGSRGVILIFDDGHSSSVYLTLEVPAHRLGQHLLLIALLNSGLDLVDGLLQVGSRFLEVGSHIIRIALGGWLHLGHSSLGVVELLLQARLSAQRLEQLLIVLVVLDDGTSIATQAADLGLDGIAVGIIVGRADIVGCLVVRAHLVLEGIDSDTDLLDTIGILQVHILALLQILEVVLQIGKELVGSSLLGFGIGIVGEILVLRVVDDLHLCFLQRAEVLLLLRSLRLVGIDGLVQVAHLLPCRAHSVESLCVPIGIVAVVRHLGVYLLLSGVERAQTILIRSTDIEPGVARGTDIVLQRIKLPAEVFRKLGRLQFIGRACVVLLLRQRTEVFDIFLYLVVVSLIGLLHGLIRIIPSPVETVKQTLCIRIGIPCTLVGVLVDVGFLYDIGKGNNAIGQSKKLGAVLSLPKVVLHIDIIITLLNDVKLTGIVGQLHLQAGLSVLALLPSIGCTEVFASTADDFAELRTELLHRSGEVEDQGKLDTGELEFARGHGTNLDPYFRWRVTIDSKSDAGGILLALIDSDNLGIVGKRGWLQLILARSQFFLDGNFLSGGDGHGTVFRYGQIISCPCGLVDHNIGVGQCCNGGACDGKERNQYIFSHNLI